MKGIHGQFEVWAADKHSDKLQHCGTYDTLYKAKVELNKEFKARNGYCYGKVYKLLKTISSMDYCREEVFAKGKRS